MLITHMQSVSNTVHTCIVNDGLSCEIEYVCWLDKYWVCPKGKCGKVDHQRKSTCKEIARMGVMGRTLVIILIHSDWQNTGSKQGISGIYFKGDKSVRLTNEPQCILCRDKIITFWLHLQSSQVPPLMEHEVFAIWLLLSHWLTMRVSPMTFRLQLSSRGRTIIRTQTNYMKRLFLYVDLLLSY